MKTVQKDIRERTFRRVYLIFGEEAYLRQSLKQRLRAAIVGEDDMNFLYLEGKDTDPRVIMDTAETMPFFAEKRLIVAENTGFFKRDVGELADYLERIPETACLVFVEESVDKRSKLFKRVQKLGYAAECGRQTPEELARWAARGLAQAGKKITGADMHYFLSRTGEDMENIRGELEKLISYTGEREVVTRADIDAITTQQISGRIFDMIDAIALRNQKKALDLYYDLLVLREPPMRIMVLIARQFHAILQVKEMREEGLNKSRIAEHGRWKPFLVDRYMRQASRFGKEELERFVNQCVEMDEAVKRGDLRDGMAAELLIVGLTGK